MLLCGSEVLSECATTVWVELKETYDKLDSSILFSFTQSKKCLNKMVYIIISCILCGVSLIHSPKFPHVYVLLELILENIVNFMKFVQFLIGLNDVYEPMRSSLSNQIRTS